MGNEKDTQMGKKIFKRDAAGNRIVTLEERQQILEAIRAGSSVKEEAGKWDLAENTIRRWIAIERHTAGVPKYSRTSLGELRVPTGSVSMDIQAELALTKQILAEKLLEIEMLRRGRN